MQKMAMPTAYFFGMLLFAIFPTLSFAQTGSALPAGYFHVSGNQIVSGGGQNVRLSCIGYDEPTGNNSSDMAKIRAAGFNCVRQSWYDATSCPKGVCNFSAQDAVVKGAASNGIPVIWNHHGNEGVNGSSGRRIARASRISGMT